MISTWRLYHIVSFQIENTCFLIKINYIKVGLNDSKTQKVSNNINIWKFRGENRFHSVLHLQTMKQNHWLMVYRILLGSGFYHNQLSLLCFAFFKKKRRLATTNKEVRKKGLTGKYIFKQSDKAMPRALTPENIPD